MEEWRPIPGTGGRYDLSSEGRVRAWFHHRDATVPIKEPRILNLTKDYHSKTMLVTLYYPDGGGQKTHRIRSLMRDVFMDGPIPGMCVKNKNGDWQCNSLSNLGYFPGNNLSVSFRIPVKKMNREGVVDIYPSITAAANANFLTPSGMRYRIIHHIQYDGCWFEYEEKRRRDR